MYSSRMHFFSFEPETEVDWPEIGVGRKGVRDWGGAGSSAAFLFDAATKAAGVEEGCAFLGCLIDCLVWDLFLMTKELCNLSLSPCSKDLEGWVAPPEEEMVEPILARQDEY